MMGHAARNSQTHSCETFWTHLETSHWGKLRGTCLAPADDTEHDLGKKRADRPGRSAMPVSKQSRSREGQTEAERGVRDIGRRGGPFVAAVEATRMPMAVTDPGVADNPIVYANAAFLELCGYDRDEVLGQNYFFLIGQHADPAVAARVEAAMAARRRFIEDVPFHAKNGREVWVSMFVSPVAEEGRVVQHFASFLDISDRVARERELREAKEALDRRVATRTKRLRQANARLEEEGERRRRAEAPPRA